jgi:acetoacetate decarboxylase
MGFVKRPEEIERIQRAITHPRFVSAEMLSIDFLTDEAVVEHILPPPLEPADQPRLSAMIGRWRSNCVGDYKGGAIYVAARHEGIDGDYVLAMYMDGDSPIIYGRDVFGEPKKQGTSALYRSGDTFHGWVERHGVRLIELHAQLGNDLGPFETEGTNYNFKARPAADGVGLQEDAILTRATFEVRGVASREGTGSVELHGTVHDPLDELPVRSVVRGFFMECDLIASCRAVATVPAEVFLPYHHGRHDDWSALDTESVATVALS